MQNQIDMESLMAKQYERPADPTSYEAAYDEMNRDICLYKQAINDDEVSYYLTMPICC